jgi:hypothetical protein
MINESLLLLIASSVTYLIKFQSQISNVVDRSSELQIRKVFESFDKLAKYMAIYYDDPSEVEDKHRKGTFII